MSLTDFQTVILYDKALLVQYLGKKRGTQDVVCCLLCFSAVRSFDFNVHINLSNTSVVYLLCNLFTILPREHQTRELRSRCTALCSAMSAGPVPHQPWHSCGYLGMF